MTKLRAKHLFLLEEIERSGGESGGVRLCFELLAVADAIDRDCAARLARHGLSEGRFVILSMLERATGALPPSVLAERAGVTKGTITGLLDGLEREGLARRVPDASDGRALLVHATDRGAALARKLLSEHTTWIAGLFAALAESNAGTLSGLLNQVWAATDEGSASRPNGDRRTLNG